MSPKVRKGLSIFTIVCGVFILVASLMFGPVRNIVLGIVITVAGIVNLTRKEVQ